MLYNIFGSLSIKGCRARNFSNARIFWDMGRETARMRAEAKWVPLSLIVSALTLKPNSLSKRLLCLQYQI